MSEKINNNKSTQFNCDRSTFSRLMVIDSAFIKAVGDGVTVSEYPAQEPGTPDFKFEHIVIKTKTKAKFDHYVLKALDLIDITRVTDYPEGCIVFIDASNGLPDEFCYHLEHRAITLLSIVNANYREYSRIEDCAAYRDLVTTLNFIHKYKDKFNTYNKTDIILVRRYDRPGVYLDMVRTFNIPGATVPKPTMIADNPRYKDYETVSE